MPFVWSVGTILGPCIGGYFAEPVESFPGHFSEHGLFARFPYLLPNLICAALMALSIVAGYFFLQETHPEKQFWSEPLNENIIESIQRMRADSSAMATQPTDLAPAVNLTRESYGTFNAVEEDAVEEEWHLKHDGTSRTPSIRSRESESPKVFTKQIVMLTIALGIFTYHSMTYDHLMPIYFQDDRVPMGGQEIMSVLAETANTQGSMAGGLSLSVKKVGIIMSVNGVIALFVQAVVFPIMASLLGVWRVFLVVTILHPIAYFIVPFLALLPQNLLYPGIYACLTIRNCLSILAYPVLLILIKEASPGPQSLGKINGLAASTGAACRTIASPIAGLLYGIGINIGFTALAWWASALVALIGAIQALTIKRKDNGPQHQIRAAAPCRFIGDAPESEEQMLRRKVSVVCIRVQETDSGYASEDERRPLIAAEV
jgi:MFS family permease